MAAQFPPVAQAVTTYSVSIKGTVVCDWSSDAVQGVWVENLDGGDKWASWWAFPGRSNAAYYSVTVTATRPDPVLRLDIGCGRTSSGGWRRTLLTPDFRTRNGYPENRRCIGTQTAANRARVCKPSPTRTLTYNTGIRGYCTWGALEKWRSFVGSYPNITGHAINMDNSAKANGFYVSSVPHIASMVVWNTSGYGHVGWVTAVRKTNGRVYFDSFDMNVGSWVDQAAGITTGFNQYKSRTNIPWDTSVHAFIVAPT
ncbi:CHAP domain-containing protein [Nocardioides silvaticus]|nr:CHAP domain-containing protein [Nocardioides silvaticus]